MRKTLTAALAAITLGGAVCATAAPAEAQHRGGSFHGGAFHGGGFRGDHFGHRGNGGAAVFAGVAGLALGAALASNHGYGYGYYGGPAYYDDYGYPGYRTCETTRWVWDPYVGRRVPVREAYAC
jgi:hypothetical protein